ncbi:MAG: hypothetical protein JXQ71_04540 [Verrucomicrobia bacterium]|nr:hypothetical protein [Verrucomicrobiota bacterium]
MSERLDLMPQGPEPPQGRASVRSPWARTILWVGVIGMLVAAAVYAFKACVETPERIIRQAGATLSTVAGAFQRGVVSNAFFSYATTLTNHLRLQVATLSQMEVFTRQEAPLTGFGTIPLPDVVVEARAPVHYTYYLDLDGEWRFVLENQVVSVHAPRIRFNKPAVDVSAIAYEVKRGFLKTDGVLENLKRTISALVVLRARDNLPLVRETCRVQTAAFVERWLMHSFTDGREYVVKVRFADEAEVERGAREGFPFE